MEQGLRERALGLEKVPVVPDQANAVRDQARERAGEIQMIKMHAECIKSDLNSINRRMAELEKIND